MARLLRWLVWAMGIACITIGLAHVVFGIASVPGEAGSGATVDSRERFYGAIFLGYGVAWIWAGRQSPIPSTPVRWLAGIFLLGGLARLLSMVVHGAPHWFQTVLTVVEIALAPVYAGLATADEKAAQVGQAPAAGHGDRTHPATT